MPKLKLDLDYETMDQITVANLKETHRLILKQKDHDEDDDAMLRSLEDVIKYFSYPKDWEKWVAEVAVPMWEKVRDA